ncbi:DNA polymerase kappa [Escovopsis weberi]|uniref:DNA polymerase kappa n=1 Tax=Escovopsis weberi TaxID=150374 RepID=A0A0M9VXS2_ESCWE|nr:DNA polymerase kappa [Escovopsis weberi]
MTASGSAEGLEDKVRDGGESPQAQLDGQQAKEDEYRTLKYHLLGPSLTKAGQTKVDQSKVSEIIYNASKGSKYFNREELRDRELTQRIERILARKLQLEKHDLTRDLRNADRLLAELELERDLTQHIVHVDCDAFYAAVEQLDRPELKEVPFAVGGGVLTTCNYVARQFGVRSGMAGFVAKKLCPQLIMIKPNFQKYSAKAREVREIMANYDPRFESASIDEAYLNITEYCRDKNMGPAEVVDQMRREIHEAAKVTVSAGIAANARLAKICSDRNKPNGQFVLPSDRSSIMAFMNDLPTRKVNGIGRVLERELSEIGVKTCGDIYGQRQYLNQLFGDKTFEFLLRCYLGLGRTKIQPADEYERKSVGTESTFRDMSGPAQLREQLRWTADSLEKDMRRAECKGRTLVLKVKLHTFEVLTRQVATPWAVCSADDLYNFSLPILSKLEQEIPGMKLRLMGLRCTQLVSTKKPDAMAFFGFRPRSGGDAAHDARGHGVKRSATGGAFWRGDDDDDDDDDDWEPVPDEPTGLDDPDAGLLVATDGRAFNEHVDLCLSRRTIRDALQADGGPSRREVKRVKLSEKKRGRSRSSDPRQKKLSFG